MESHGDQTAQTYRDHFSKYVERTPSAVGEEFQRWMDAFLSRLPKGGSIIELGSAAGRDAKYFRSKGFAVTCTDIVPEALNALAKEGFVTAPFDFRDDPDPAWVGSFDGLFANAVLLHAGDDELKKALRSASAMVKDGGVVAFSVKAGEGEEISMAKMDAPRYFNYHSREGLLALIEGLPFEVISLYAAEDGKWLQAMLKNQKTPANLLHLAPTVGRIRPHLHKYLRLRLGIYLAVSVSVGAFVVYDAITKTVPGIYAMIGVLVGMIVGFAASRIHKIFWDERAAKAVARMDAFGIVVLVLYFAFEFFRERIVGRFVAPADVTVTSFSILAGLMYGRVLGIRGNVVKVLEERDIL